jgi:hypothetical protein
MITFAKLTYDILELLKGNHVTDDTDLMERQVMYHIANQRALWIRNEYNKPGRSIDPDIISDLGCLELELVDAADCCNIETDCYALRTKKQLPSFIELHDSIAITRVGLPHKLTLPFTFTNYHKVIYSLSNKYSKSQVYGFLLNGYIYLLSEKVNIKMLDYINVQGVLEDPMDLADFKCENGNPCFDINGRYPIKSWMVPYITSEVVKLLGIGIKTPQDVANDANDKPTQQ